MERKELARELVGIAGKLVTGGDDDWKTVGPWLMTKYIARFDISKIGPEIEDKIHDLFPHWHGLDVSVGAIVLYNTTGVTGRLIDRWRHEDKVPNWNFNVELSGFGASFWRKHGPSVIEQIETILHNYGWIVKKPKGDWLDRQKIKSGLHLYVDTKERPPITQAMKDSRKPAKIKGAKISVSIDSTDSHPFKVGPAELTVGEAHGEGGGGHIELVQGRNSTDAVDFEKQKYVGRINITYADPPQATRGDYFQDLWFDSK